MNRVKNFNAGPAALPLPALERARDEFLDFAGSGMSVMEHSHRGKEYEACHDEAIALLKELLAVPDTHEVLFVQGGASQLFAQIPMNLVQKGGSADYVVTGAWSEKAVSEAKAGHRHAGRRGPGGLHHRHRRGQGEELRPRPGARRGEGRRRRRLPAPHLQRDHPRRGVRRRSGARLPGHRRGAARRRHVERLPLEEVRRLEVRPGLRRRPEEHRPVGRGGGGGVEGAHRAGAQGHPQDLPVPHPGREQVALQHPAHLRHLHDPQRAGLAEGAGWPPRHGGAQPQEGRRALRRHRRQPGLLPVPGRAGRAAR